MGSFGLSQKKKQKQKQVTCIYHKYVNNLSGLVVLHHQCVMMAYMCDPNDSN